MCTLLGQREGVQIQLRYCFTSRLKGGGWSDLRPGRFSPGKGAVGTY